MWTRIVLCAMYMNLTSLDSYSKDFYILITPFGSFLFTGTFHCFKMCHHVQKQKKPKCESTRQTLELAVSNRIDASNDCKYPFPASTSASIISYPVTEKKGKGEGENVLSDRTPIGLLRITRV